MVGLLSTRGVWVQSRWEPSLTGAACGRTGATGARRGAPDRRGGRPAAGEHSAPANATRIRANPPASAPPHPAPSKASSPPTAEQAPARAQHRPSRLDHPLTLNRTHRKTDRLRGAAERSVRADRHGRRRRRAQVSDVRRLDHLQGPRAYLARVLPTRSTPAGRPRPAARPHPIVHRDRSTAQRCPNHPEHHRATATRHGRTRRSEPSHHPRSRHRPPVRTTRATRREPASAPLGHCSHHLGPRQSGKSKAHLGLSGAAAY